MFSLVQEQEDKKELRSSWKWIGRMGPEVG